MYSKQVSFINENGAMEKASNRKGWTLAAQGVSINAVATTS